MLTIEPDSGIEKYLCDKAFEKQSPINGTFELTPTCNMSCSMCYIRMSSTEISDKGLLSVNDWIRIGKEAVANGCVFLLLTGGEPLLYPSFSNLYMQLRDLGLIVTINTNGTLIDNSLIKVLKGNQPRRINISLYGSSNETYAKLCHNPQGFTQTMKGIHLLLENGIQVKANLTLTPQNIQDLDSMIDITEKLGIPITIANYTFPPVRKENVKVEELVRLNPQQAAYVQFYTFYKEYYNLPNFKENIENKLNGISICQYAAREEVTPPGGLLCTAGVSSFWVNWRGEISPCGMLQKPIRSLKEYSFKEGWEAIKTETKQIFTSKKCFNCRFRKICKACGAASFAENHDFSLPAAYHCELNEAYEKLLKEELNKLEQESE